MGRWSAETCSDNEILHKNSPNPLPNPDVTPETCLRAIESEQYIVQGHFNNRYNSNVPFKGDYMAKLNQESVNYQEYDRCSDLEEKHHMNEKYLFPYTGKLTYL